MGIFDDKPRASPPPIRHPKSINDYEGWMDQARAVKEAKDKEDFLKKIEELMGETDDDVPVPKKAPATTAAQQVFMVDRVNNGFIVSVTGRGKWVCESPEGLMDAIKMALADARLL